jgi:hypothetical protein
MPANITTNKIDIDVKTAENMASLDSPLKVRGNEQTKQAIAVMKAKEIVQIEWSVIVFRYSAPTKQCNP